MSAPPVSHQQQPERVSNTRDPEFQVVHTGPKDYPMIAKQLKRQLEIIALMLSLPASAQRALITRVCAPQGKPPPSAHIAVVIK